MARTLKPIPFEAILEAQTRLVGTAVRTPLVRLNVDSSHEIWLKLENLQPIGSFKLRGAGNAMAAASPMALAQGVYTASAGNMAQGVAYCARRLGVPCTVVVPDHAPATKLEAIARLGGSVRKVPFETWWQILVDHHFPGLEGLFIHPVSDPLVMAGNGTIGLEIADELPQVGTVLVPFGGGGLACGIASALRHRSPRVKILGCEVETAAPLSISLAQHAPQTIAYTPSFVDGAGSKSILPDMWPLVHQLVDGARVVSLRLAADAVRLLATRNRIIAEGAGALSVAAALSDSDLEGPVVCIVSGGNIDASKLVKILNGDIP